MVATMVVVIVIDLVQSWKFGLGFLLLVPLIGIAEKLRLTMCRGVTREEQEALENAGKVTVYRQFNTSYSVAMLFFERQFLSYSNVVHTKPCFTVVKFGQLSKPM